MGMPIVLDLRDELDDDVVERAFDELRHADAVFSTYKDDSDISRLNRGELALEDAHPDVREVLERCEELRVITGGYPTTVSITMVPVSIPNTSSGTWLLGVAALLLALVLGIRLLRTRRAAAQLA